MITGRRTEAVIDLGALAHNLKEIKQHLSKNDRLMAVVKANAYGHGAVAVARELVAQHVDFLGVATLEEGIELRKADIKLPIVILSGVLPGQAREAVAYDLETVIYDLKVVEELSAAALSAGKNTSIHVKVDSGMGRLGLLPDEVPNFMARLKTFPGIFLNGVMSHFALADNPHAAAGTIKQRDLFRGVLSWLADAGYSPRYIHMDNSAAILTSGHSSYPLVRVGIALYGCYPATSLRGVGNLKPVMSLRTRIIELRRLPPGWGVSYEHTYVTEKESLIAVLPVGYADGYARRLSNRFYALVRGRRAPLVGNICMDLAMMDVSAIPEVQVGDVVTLIGRDGEEEITAEAMADCLETISYEILTDIGPRVSRVYQGGLTGER